VKDMYREGTILSVNVSSEKGQKKHNIGRCLLAEGLGVEGDAHAGMEIRQVSLLAKESIEKIWARGLKVQYGDFAENLTTEGINLVALPVGTRLFAGQGVTLEVTQIGKECHSGCAIYKLIGKCVMPKEGVFARVVKGGVVKAGDELKICEM
jgi:molybdopterin adenylyltransferase